MTNPHKGSNFEDFLKEEGIEALCKVCKKEKALGITFGTFKILICNTCGEYKDIFGNVQLITENVISHILERLEALENKS